MASVAYASSTSPPGRGVSKATTYRRWHSKEELAIELLREQAGQHVAVAETGDTPQELVSVTLNAVERLTTSSFGPVIRALLCEIAASPAVGDRFRATVIETRRDEARQVVERGIARGDLRPLDRSRSGDRAPRRAGLLPPGFRWPAGARVR